jgi:hypothetical protein
MNLLESDFIDFVQAKCGDTDKLKLALEANIISIDGGYKVTVNDDEIEVTLASVRKKVRRFATIDSASAFLRKIGFSSFNCNLR